MNVFMFFVKLISYFFGFCFLLGFIKADYRRQNAEKKVGKCVTCIIDYCLLYKLRSVNYTCSMK